MFQLQPEIRTGKNEASSYCVCSVCNGDAEEKENLDREPQDREKAEMGKGLGSTLIIEKSVIQEEKKRFCC